jgi:hypothetical protein
VLVQKPLVSTNCITNTTYCPYLVPEHLGLGNQVADCAEDGARLAAARDAASRLVNASGPGPARSGDG